MLHLFRVEQFRVPIPNMLGYKSVRNRIDQNTPFLNTAVVLSGLNSPFSFDLHQ